jgi:S-adenosyl methyltransferase
VVSEEYRPRLSEDHFRKPSSARVWNYWLGGKDNYPVDHAAGDAVVAVYPDIVRAARESRRFLVRVVRYLAGELGVRQFLDIGTGLPTMQNTHEVAQAVAPDARVVYVDNDPVVLAHARALLTNTDERGVTAYIDADVHRPAEILAEARATLDFDRPIAVLFFGILGHVADFERARAIVAEVLAALPSGSYLAAEDSTNTGAQVREAGTKYAESGAIPYHLRGPEQIALLFTGLELVEPGVVPVTQWRPGPVLAGSAVEPIDKYGGVARKP